MNWRCHLEEKQILYFMLINITFNTKSALYLVFISKIEMNIFWGFGVFFSPKSS